MGARAGDEEAGNGAAMKHTPEDVAEIVAELRLSKKHFDAIEYRSDSEDIESGITMLEAYADLLERARWIPVEEQLPELDKEVEAINSDGLRTVKRWERKLDKKWFWSSTCMDSCGCCDSFDENITHWRELQPLPQPPEEP